MRRLPPARRLAAKIAAVKSNARQTLADSIRYLVGKRTDLQAFPSLEEMVCADDADQPKLRKAVEHHVFVLRRQILRELWSHQLFIGASVIDDLLYNAVVHTTVADPVLRVLEAIRDNGLHRPGLVIYPAHSFGLLGAGIFRWATGSSVEWILPESGIALSPQTNNLQDTIRFLERVRQGFGVRKRVPEDSIRHWFVTRAPWLERNPLLVSKVQAFSGSYYENQSLLIAPLRVAASFVSMLASLQPDVDDAEFLWSSARVNNFQTLDFKHYIVLSSGPAGGVLRGECVPMQVQRPVLAELAALGVDVNPLFWSRRPARASAVHESLAVVQAGYLRHVVGNAEETILSRVYRKMFDALGYFRRSFLPSAADWSAVVSLAIAFEMVLTDRCSKGIGARVERRARLALRGVPGVRAMARTVAALYAARGEIVHHGGGVTNVDMKQAQRAFVHVFMSMAARLAARAPATDDPMQELCGDSTK